jgi:lipoprotein-anchoring transpeptidase ErfK/SrfK
MTEDSKMTRVSVLRSSVATGTLLRIALLTAAGTLGAVTNANAEFYYFRDSDPGYYNQEQAVQQPRRQQHSKRSSAKAKKEVAVKDTTVHPQMPLIINVSIAKQKVRVYDANGLFAEAAVSTGMPGHPTPMGVFSVIQKDRYHHSNIYSGAPMPFMQRITWGGVALHAGVLPGYPASHGCIRMPESFAIKMWGWTKMGARVIVSQGELSPENFAHASLPTMKVAPPPPVVEMPEAPLGAKTDKGAPDVAANLELRSSVGHSDNPPLRDQTHTADASGNVSASTPTMSDASAANGTPAHDADAKATDSKPEAAKAEEPKVDGANGKSDNAPSASTDTVGKDTASVGASTKPTEVADAAKPGEAAAADKPADGKPATATLESKPVQAADAASKPADKAAKTEPAKRDTAKQDTAKPDTAKADAAKADAAKPADKPTAPVKSAGDATPAAADAKKDPTRMVGDKPVKPDIKRKDGQIAVFISRKDSKLYVRQNFAPLFEVPVAIAASDRPLGTHVFTAEFDKNDPNLLHWTVVTVPPTTRAAMRGSDEPRHSRRKGKPAQVVEAKPVPDSPTEALDRITIPPDVMARVLDAMSSGGSIIVSDQGIAQGETGEYTDFIVRTY